MSDPLEGRTREGMIATGVGVDRIPLAYRDVIDAAIEHTARIGASLYLYGSVATGQARPPRSDVDLLTIGLSAEAASTVSAALSGRFTDLCRAVEVAHGMPEDFTGEGDAAYGGRVFLHHYCVHLAGVDHDRATDPFPADRRAARGFNGDIGQVFDTWRARLETADPPKMRSIARKTLFAVGGLVSIHDDTWTTDRIQSAKRWGEVEPALAEGLVRLATAGDDDDRADERDAAAWALSGVVPAIVAQFSSDIGLWGEGDAA